ncbi:MAG TPA: CHASE3 domain-containing protein, partial [Blastocatellia bacterium]|nr:CHASE3 domain-containing protein [Blastocatellia bacterium]
LTLAMLILSAIGIGSYYNTARLMSTARWVEHTHMALERLSALLQQIAEAESEGRGYLITENDAFLESHEASFSAIRRSLEEVRSLVSDNPSQAERVSRLEPHVNARLSLLRELIDLSKQRRLDPATRLALVGRGKEEMGLIRAIASEMEDGERALLARRYESAEAATRRTLAMNLVGSLLSFALLALAFYLLNLEIGRRRRAESALQETTSLQRAILDSANYTIISTAPDGTIKSFNAAAERMLGYTAREVVGKTTPALFHDSNEVASRAEVLSSELGVRIEPGFEAFIAGARAGGPDENEWTYIRKDGSSFPVLLSITALRDNRGAIKGFLGIGSDITERKAAAEKQTALMKELESANQELNDFAYVVSHDLKAPLRAIGSLASWISSDYADKFDEDGKEQMGLLRGRVKRMHDLIDGILQYSRVGRIKEQMAEVDLDALAREVIGMLSPPRNIRVTIEGALPTVMCERTRMEQVFQNLLSNALKFMDKPDGEISIRCEDGGEEWVFSVSDNGPGIEEKHFAKIFQIFQTLAPRDQFESTGVGLSVVKKSVEMCGGRVWVESTPGSGSAFFFTLPMRAFIPRAGARGGGSGSL